MTDLIALDYLRATVFIIQMLPPQCTPIDTDTLNLLTLEIFTWRHNCEKDANGGGLTTLFLHARISKLSMSKKGIAYVLMKVIKWSGSSPYSDYPELPLSPPPPKKKKKKKKRLPNLWKKHTNYWHSLRSL